MCLKGESCSGGKMAKDRLTIMLCVNLDGEFETPLIIGKSARPRCFKRMNINDLKVDWNSNKKAWMTQDIMTEWLIKFNAKMKSQNRQILLFMDNATCHPKIDLTNIKLIFFPPNTTSVCQPLDQGAYMKIKLHKINKIKSSFISTIN